MSDRPDDTDDIDAQPAARARARREPRDDDELEAHDAQDDDELKDELKDVRERGFASKMIGDLAKRALMTGIGAVFMSEESLKSQLSEMKLPKEAMNYVVGQADKTKKEIVAVIARETRDFLSKLEMDKVLSRVLTGTTIEIQTRIKILPKDGGGITAAVESNDASLVDEERPRRKRKKRDEDG